MVCHASHQVTPGAPSRTCTHGPPRMALRGSRGSGAAASCRDSEKNCCGSTSKPARSSSRSPPDTQAAPFRCRCCWRCCCCCRPPALCSTARTAALHAASTTPLSATAHSSEWPRVWRVGRFEEVRVVACSCPRDTGAAAEPPGSPAAAGRPGQVSVMPPWDSLAAAAGGESEGPAAGRVLVLHVAIGVGGMGEGDGVAPVAAVTVRLLGVGAGG